MAGRTKSYIEQYQRMMRFYDRMNEKCEKRHEISNICDQIPGTEDTLIGSNKPAIVYTSKDIIELIPKYIDKNDLVEESCDMIYAFFQNCFHLKDWIKVDKPELKGKVERLFEKENQNPNFRCMKICADLCNGSKHCELTRKELIRIDPNTDVDVRMLKASFNFMDDNLSFYINYEILSDNDSYDVLELAGRCIAKWDEFMKDNSLPNYL